MEHTLRPSTEPVNSSEVTPEQKEDQLSTESSEDANNPTPSEQSNPLRVDTTEEGRITVIVGAPPAVKASASGLTSMQVERHIPTKSSDDTEADTSEQSNPFSDPCFEDVTEQWLGKHIAIVGAPPPLK